jgi:chemotaxis protein MotB
MLRKPISREPELGGRWTVSYVDVLTLLLVLFMAISAQAVRLQLNRAQPAPEPAAPAESPKTPPARQALLEAQAKLEEFGLHPTLETRGLVISLPQAVLFPPGSDEVAASAYPVVEQIAQVLLSIPNPVCLVGHADAVPIHNRRFRNNWELSAARSLRLLELLVNRYGVPEWRLSTAGYGSQRPRDTNETAQGRAANRRVEIVILDAEEQAAAGEPEPEELTTDSGP